jgi:hypothetical protein
MQTGPHVPACATNPREFAARDFRKVSHALDVFDATEPPDERVGTDCGYEQNDQQGVHLRHSEKIIGLDNEEADAAV